MASTDGSSTANPDTPGSSRQLSTTPEVEDSPMENTNSRPSRAAALRAKAGIKRTFRDEHQTQDLEQDTPQGPTTKRRRRYTTMAEPDGPADSEPSHSQSTPETAQPENVQQETPTNSTESTGGGFMNSIVAKMIMDYTDTHDQPENLPEGSGKPLVWAIKRGSLCEALPYFKSHKASLYTADLVAQGVLIDQEMDQRDVFGPQVIITSIGGGRVKNERTGTMVRSKDARDNSPNTKSAMNALKNKTLVAVIAGEGHPLYPCKPPAPYAVLGYFHITDMWKEKQIPQGAKSPVTIWRMRFEKADLTEPSWWVPNVAEAIPSDTCTGVSIKAPAATCGKCKTTSKEIFTAGWICLNHECKHYFCSSAGTEVALKRLTYTEAFLNERTPFAGTVPSIVPPMPSGEGLHGTELALRRGFVCPTCGCCNRRVYWNRWVCENEECLYASDAPMLPYPAECFGKESAKFDELVHRRSEQYGVNENTLHRNDYPHDPFATIYQRGYLSHSQTLQLGDYRVRQYFLPDSQGRILGSFTIFGASEEALTHPEGPTTMFRTLELTDIGLRRNPAAVVGHKLEGYTRHFQQNFGAKYKFGVAVQSRGFSEAPDVILRALHRLIWAKKVAVGTSNAYLSTLDPKLVGEGALVTRDTDFNELLALGYMEDDKINYHDDGEKELGPAVAALSLGSPSTMRFRPKAKTGFQLPTQKEQGRVVYKEVLEVTMRHGDMMVMAGPNIQKIYEHTVIPHGMRRFSLTARYIDPERMASQEDRDDAAIKGAIPAHAQAFVYNGH